MRKRIYVEVQHSFCVGVHSEDFDVGDLEFVVIDRDTEANNEQSAEDCEFFDNLPTNPNSLFQVNAKDERI